MGTHPLKIQGKKKTLVNTNQRKNKSKQSTKKSSKDPNQIGLMAMKH